MTRSTNTKLKIVVERAVRPVRASTLCKRKMREELLAHVVAAFEEEFIKLRNEQAAIQQTERRFGIPDELTHQLQASVPKPDWQFWFEHLVGFPEGESTLRRAARHFALIALVFLPCIPIFILRGRMREWPILVGMPILAFTFTYLIHWMRHALFLSTKRNWPVAILILIVSAISMPMVTFAMCLAISGSLTTSWTMVLPLVPLSVLFTPIVLTVCAYCTAVETRKDREWETLPLIEM